MSQDHFSQIVPASWTYRDSQVGARFASVPLSERLRFIPFGRVGTLTSDQFSSGLHRHLLEQPTVVKGVPKELVPLLPQDGYVYPSFGLEALIPLASFEPSPSLLELSERAKKKGRVERAPLAVRALNGDKHSHVRLRALFRRAYVQSFSSYCYVLEGRTVAQVVCSKRAPTVSQIERIERIEEAPIGAVEGLIIAAIDDCKRTMPTGIFSLGEVPCHTRVSHEETQATQFERVISFSSRSLGRWLLKRSYSPDGLYRFKEKFHPEWRTLHWSLPSEAPLRALFLVGNVTRINGLLIEGGKKRFQFTHATTSNLVPNRI